MHSSHRREFLRRATALAGAAAASRGFDAIAAETWPAHPLTVVVSFGPGGVGDIVARTVSQRLAKNLGQAVVVENRPIPVMGPALVAKAKPDGYSMIVSGNGTAVTAALFNSLPFDLMKDFAHVSSMASVDMAVIAPGDSAFNTVTDAIAFAKANPGKLSVGSARVGSTQNLAAEMFRAMAGVELVLVPYKAPGDLLAALHSKDVQLAFELVPAVLPQISAKNVKALAVASRQRFPGLPQLPTVNESGIPGFEATSWMGISVPAATPPAIVERLATEIQRAVAASEVQLTLQNAGIRAESSTPAQMTERLRQDLVKWRAVIDKAGIPKQ